ncbi:hypothetical protein [Cellulosimicrobium sp. I38E]|uniref:hypothetical protein n=1 Tax=Cellulosimicrobium sp. I38E TaxID=1393139 RepID=UPI0007B283F3|nr:hypothetical protein [Cellulosimicrobium sp. I38E]KZM79070.1 hypothetical protein A0J59_11170 [Cellulosimicrobium sp. I38E]
MADTGSTPRSGAHLVLATATILVLVIGVAALSALFVGRAVNQTLPFDIGAHSGVVDAEAVAEAVADLDGVDSVSVEKVPGDTFVPTLGLVIVHTDEPWNQVDIRRLATPLRDHAAPFNPSRPVHVAIATPKAFIAVSGDIDDNAARIEAADEALDAGALAVHVAPHNFDVMEWSAQGSGSPALVMAVPRAGADPRDLQDALGPEVVIADDVRWVESGQGD